MSEQIRVALVDDQTLIRSALATLIGTQPDLTVVATAAHGREAVDSPELRAADVILMDVRMPVMDGIEATRAILSSENGASASHPRIIMLTTFDIDEYVLEAIDAGASGFLLKDAPPEELLSGIRAVHRGDAVIAPSATRRLLSTFAHAGHKQPSTTDAAISALTPREREVLIAMSDGLSNCEIAEKFVLSEATVKTHVSRILAKLGARDRVQAVVAAYRSGLVE
ncbi:response regulator [Neoactinobaculum massilliense]|uniref:response regulator n=1 Tax=Neoactinobaculum massilliense TaxID=2364794 RepID=UPI000F51B409|nr:response regulator transcription factor [Neoactinobaculum massilliense]